ncbi:MAG: GH92 family glycosyl hydrolase [Tannerella sp.]|jgi:predicted alpha-1,2-mannosidase|nr:GH92 family glycosyl hydrolase [Tannerella sp.]
MNAIQKIGLYAALPLIILSCHNTGNNISGETVPELKNLTQYVDPYIGTGDHGHVFMGANVPFGLVQLGPTNISQGWDWCSGYHISDSTIMGFSHMHLSGTGIGDLGDISFMPVIGEVKLERGKPEDKESGMYSLFDRSTERARAGYYAVTLNRHGIDVELTATKRVGFHKYTFPESSDARIIIDLVHGIGWDAVTDGDVVQENDTVISGYRYSKGWANDQRIYFTAVFSKPMKEFILNSVVRETKNGEERRYTFAQLLFDTKANEEIFAKVALSPVSVENAKMNMASELPGWDFEQTVANADVAWNEELNKIDFQANDKRTRTIFYTALYHTMIAPSEFCDVNKDYYGTDKQVHRQVTFTNYTTFSLWDTYRAAHPLMTIIHPEKMPDIINTMLTVYQEQGKLPVWHLMANETDCMVGNPGVCVVADAVLKDFGGFDKNVAYEALKNSVMLDERGQKWMREYGYIPFDKEVESVAKTMEYAIADWSVAQVANAMGKTDDYKYFKQLSEGYKYYFDPELQFMRGKDSGGKFRELFNPFHSVHRENDYTEGTAWQYTWLVPHDVEGLVNLFGSKEAFLSKLDSLFIVNGDMGEEASPDISGLIGQYAHGNEPGHHVLYLYSVVGEPAKTAEKVREVLETMYTDQPAGLCGNEDVGQMSAWYILSALGFYQVEPAGGKYYFGSPVMNEASVNVGNGKIFKIVAKNNNTVNKYIKSVTLNGAPYEMPYIDFKDIIAGGELVFEMSSTLRAN